MSFSRGMPSAGTSKVPVGKTRVLTGMAGIYLAMGAIVLLYSAFVLLSYPHSSPHISDASLQLIGLIELVAAPLGLLAAALALKGRAPGTFPLSLPMLVMGAVQSMYTERALALTVVILTLGALLLLRRASEPEEHFAPEDSGTRAGAGASTVPSPVFRYGVPGPTTAARARTPGAHQLVAAALLVLVVGLLCLAFGMNELSTALTHYHTTVYETPTQFHVEEVSQFTWGRLMMGLLLTSAFILCSKGAFYALSRTDLYSAVWLPMAGPGMGLIGCLFFTVYFVFLFFVPVLLMSLAAFLLISRNHALFVPPAKTIGKG
jgi:hypothetical protein